MAVLSVCSPHRTSKDILWCTRSYYNLSFTHISSLLDPIILSVRFCNIWIFPVLRIHYATPKIVFPKPTIIQLRNKWLIISSLGWLGLVPIQQLFVLLILTVLNIHKEVFKNIRTIIIVSSKCTWKWLFLLTSDKGS